MLTEIKTGLTSLKTAIELLKAAKGVTDQAQIDAIFFEMRQVMANIQEQLLEAQTTANNVLEERSSLIKQLENEIEKNINMSQYKLIEPRAGVFLYAFNPTPGDETPLHTAWPNCFSKKSISILQQPDSYTHKIECPLCSFSYDPRTEEEIEKIHNQPPITRDDIFGRF